MDPWKSHTVLSESISNSKNSLLLKTGNISQGLQVNYFSNLRIPFDPLSKDVENVLAWNNQEKKNKSKSNIDLISNQNHWSWDGTKENKTICAWDEGIGRQNHRENHALRVLHDDNLLLSPRRNIGLKTSQKSKANYVHNLNWNLDKLDHKFSEEIFGQNFNLFHNNKEQVEHMEIIEDDSRSRFSYLLNPSPEKLLKEVLDINKELIDFGKHLSGKILEEQIELKNKTEQEIFLAVFINCLNPELQNAQEYIYSVRSKYQYDYSEKHHFIVPPCSILSFKAALKVPLIKLKESINGQIKIISNCFQGEIVVTLRSQVFLPKVYCPKQLYSNVFKKNIISIAISKQKNQEKKIPLKNEGEMPLLLELGFYKPEGLPINNNFEYSISPRLLTIPPKSAAIVILLVKPLKSKTKESEKLPTFEQIIMVAKGHDSNLTYSFVLRLEYY